MRTNIVLDDEIVREAMVLSGEPSKKALVDHALRAFLQRQRLLDMANSFGKIQRQGNLDQMRERQPAHGTARRHQCGFRFCVVRKCPALAGPPTGPPEGGHYTDPESAL